MDLVNLTPHTITLRRPDGSYLVVPPSGRVARVHTLPGYRTSATVSGVPVYAPPELCGVANLPPPGEDGTSAYLVSAIVRTHPSVVGRSDVVSPGTGPDDEAIRDEQGQIVAATRLIRA
jgi:hypothetical protein